MKDKIKRRTIEKILFFLSVFILSVEVLVCPFQAKGQDAKNTNNLINDQISANFRSKSWLGFQFLKDQGSSENGLNISDSKIEFDAADIERNAQLVKLRYDSSSDAIRLDRHVLYEDDGPATGRPQSDKSPKAYSYRYGPVSWVENLKKGIVIKKDLIVNYTGAVSGKLVFKGFEVPGNTEPLYLSLNGKKFIRPASRIAFPHAREYIDMNGLDRWFYVNLPIGALRKGKNEIRMWTESDSTSWGILIAANSEFKRGSLTRTPPNRSMKSSDGGNTWSDSKLGALNSMDGEYSVRINLNQYFSSGEYVSPLVDLVEGNKSLKQKVTHVKVTLQPEIKMPDHTSAKVMVRFSESPLIGSQLWTDWQWLDSGHMYALGDKRYMQWRVKLKTSDALVTPTIKGMRITMSWQDASPNHGTGLSVNVIKNGRIVRSSYPFIYEDLTHPGLKKYRKDNNLDQVVAGASSEFEEMLRLLHWAYRVPLTGEEYSWNWNKVTVNRTENGIPPMNGPYNGRRRNKMCLYSNQALIGALLAMGFQARHININSEGMSGHEVAEVWSNQFDKWIELDATRDFYYFDPHTGIPLNILQLHNLLVNEMPWVETWKHPFAPDIGKQVVSRIDVGMRQGHNSFSIEKDGRHILPWMGHFRIIPRNNFLSNPLPVPVHQGVTMWGWTGYVNWYDHTFPKRYEYQRYTNRAMDFYESLNQAKVFLSETNTPGVLKVEVATFVPGGFDTLFVKTTGGWIAEKEDSWRWNLHPGRNMIKVRTRNVRGVLGPVSYLKVNYNP